MPVAKFRLKIGGLYDITLKNGEEFFGYTVYKETRENYVVGYDGVDEDDCVRMTIDFKDIKSADQVDD